MSNPTGDEKTTAQRLSPLVNFALTVIDELPPSDARATLYFTFRAMNQLLSADFSQTELNLRQTQGREYPAL